MNELHEYLIYFTLIYTLLKLLVMILVGIMTGYGLEGPGSVPGSAKFFSSPHLPDRLWDPLSLLSNWCRGLDSRGIAAGA
jgi:hypothetical protein